VAIRMTQVICNLCLFTLALTASAQVAPPVIGELPPLKFASDRPDSNILTASIGFSTTYDDNILFNNAAPLSDITYEIKPGLSFQLTRRHLRWRLNANPGIAIHQRVGQRDLFTNAFGTDIGYELSKRLTARLRGNYTIKDDPFSSGVFTEPTPLNVLDQPTNIVITPQQRRASAQAAADVIYDVGERSTVQISGGFYTLQFSHPPGMVQQLLSDSQFTTARAHYTHRLTPRTSVGAIYQFQDLASFGTANSRTLSHSFLFSQATEITPTTAFQVFIGPQYEKTEGILFLPFGVGGTLLLPIVDSSWSWAGGATFGWQGHRTSLRMTFRHQVLNGGGLPTAARSTNASIELRRSLFAGWLGSAGVAYGENKLLNFGAQSSTRSFIASAGARHRIGQSMWFDLRYGHGHQHGEGGLLNRTGDDNRVTALLQYEFKSLLGR